MSTLDSPELAPRSRRSRTLLVSFLGAIVRRMGNWMPIAGTVELMTQAGLDAPSVRTAVFRLKERGWLDSESRGGVRGYALTSRAMSILAEGDEVIWHARQPADLADGWCIVNFSVPETDRARRHKLRAHLANLGFGNVGTAMWIAPARLLGAAERAIAELDLQEHSAIFTGDYGGPQDLAKLTAASWDLAGIDAHYRAFTAAHTAVADRLDFLGAIDPQEAFVTYLSVIDSWRRLPFRDPGLPVDVLPADWSAPDATAVFERLVALLEGRALAHAASGWPTAG